MTYQFKTWMLGRNLTKDVKYFGDSFKRKHRYADALGGLTERETIRRMDSQVKWERRGREHQDRREVGGVCVVERHLFCLLCFPDSLTFTGPLPCCFAWVYFWPTVQMKDAVFRHELFGWIGLYVFQILWVKLCITCVSSDVWHPGHIIFLWDSTMNQRADHH